ncbi:MAG: mycothiol system anti-sigma-R factor [Acidimicrobiia bacterium]
MSDYCEEALAEVYLYLDRELTWWRRRRIRRHLAMCQWCERGYEFERRLRVVVRSRLSEEVPPEFIDRLRAALRSEEIRG